MFQRALALFTFSLWPITMGIAPGRPQNAPIETKDNCTWRDDIRGNPVEQIANCGNVRVQIAQEYLEEATVFDFPRRAMAKRGNAREYSC